MHSARVSLSVRVMRECVRSYSGRAPQASCTCTNCTCTDACAHFEEAPHVHESTRGRKVPPSLSVDRGVLQLQ